MTHVEELCLMTQLRRHKCRRFLTKSGRSLKTIVTRGRSESTAERDRDFISWHPRAWDTPALNFHLLEKWLAVTRASAAVAVQHMRYAIFPLSLPDNIKQNSCLKLASNMLRPGIRSIFAFTNMASLVQNLSKWRSIPPPVPWCPTIHSIPLNG